MPPHTLFAALAMLALLVFGSAGWVWALTRRLRGEPIVPLEPRQPAPWTFVDLLIVLAAFVVVQITAAGVIRAALGHSVDLENADARQLAMVVGAQGVANVVTLAVAAAVVVLRVRATPRDLGFVWEAFSSDVALGAKAFFMLALPVLTLQGILTRWWYPSQHPLVEMLRESPDSSLFVTSVFVAVLVAPVAEEFFFRVLLQGWLEKSTTSLAQLFKTMPQVKYANGIRSRASEPHVVEMGAGRDASSTSDEVYLAEVVEEPPPPYWPMFVSAAVFALLHYSHGPDPIPLFFLAIGLGYLYRQTHRIMPCITVHFLLNALSMTMLWLELTFGE